jgi:hypothetical protein
VAAEQESTIVKIKADVVTMRRTRKLYCVPPHVKAQNGR